MPKKIEAALKKAADKKGLKGEAKDRFVYGILYNQYGWRKGKGDSKTKRK